MRATGLHVFSKSLKMMIRAVASMIEQVVRNLMAHPIKILVCVVLGAFQVVYAQDHRSAIERDFRSWIQSQDEKDFQKTISYLPDEVFELVSKDQFINSLELSLKNPDVEVGFSDPEVHTMEDSVQINDKLYSFMTCSFNTKLRFLNADRDFDQERIGVILEQLRKEHGPENVRFDNETHFFIIHSAHEAYAISSDGGTNWKFLTLDENQEELYNSVLPEELRPD